MLREEAIVPILFQEGVLLRDCDTRVDLTVDLVVIQHLRKPPILIKLVLLGSDSLVILLDQLSQARRHCKVQNIEL